VKGHHAAALALVGWYLMVPPNSSIYTLDVKAPISKWKDFKVFDSARQCESALAEYRAKFDRDEGDALPAVRAEGIEEFRVAQCVSTEDPRLKGVPYDPGVYLGTDGPAHRSLK
jgi:hypothetical protein